MLIALAAVWRPTTRVALSAVLSAWWEAAPWIDGERSPDASAYRVGPSVGVSWQASDALRRLASAAPDPRVDGFGANGSASVRATLGLAWSAR